MLLIGSLVAAVALAAQPPTIVVLGDSLSAAYGIPLERGWVSGLQEKLINTGLPHQVINASISGDTTAGALTRLPDALARHQPDWVVVELGGNDGLRGLSVKVMRENLTAIVDQSLAAGANVALVAIRIPPNYGQAYTGAFEKVYHELGERDDVVLLEFPFDDLAADPGLLQDDGIHPTADAQPLIVEAVWEDLAPVLNP